MAAARGVGDRNNLDPRFVPPSGREGSCRGRKPLRAPRRKVDPRFVPPSGGEGSRQGRKPLRAALRRVRRGVARGPPCSEGRGAVEGAACREERHHARERRRAAGWEQGRRTIESSATMQGIGEEPLAGSKAAAPLRVVRAWCHHVSTKRRETSGERKISSHY
jgi:hypothetical protein